MRPILLGAFALAAALGVADSASAQLICSKTNPQGKTTYKLRQTCKPTETLAVDVSTLASQSQIPTVRQTEIHGWSNNDAILITTTDGFVPLIGGGGDPAFTTTAASTDVVITFYGECRVGDASAWMDVDILLDSVAVDPTAGDDDAFCGGVGVLSWWTNSASVVVEDVGPGTHTVTVQARVTSGDGSFDDVGVTVITTED